MADYDDLPYIVVERRSGGLAPFFWGALVGAGLALLYAPRSGRQTRNELRDGVQRLKHTAEDAARQVQQSINGTLDDLRGQVHDRVDTARQAMDAGREAARRTREDLERRVRESQTGRQGGPPPVEGPDEFGGDDGLSS